MYFQQVFALALAFSSSRELSVVSAPPDLYYGHTLTLMPSLNPFRVVIEEDPLALGTEWNVRLVQTGSLQPPIYFPPVHNPEELESALNKAWEAVQQTLSCKKRAHISRSTEDIPTPTLPQLRTASPPSQRIHWTTQSPPRHE
jgi:hypothetical protein